MSSGTKIPLKCDICPKKPRFSDVSHLLTHISSKSHLSNIFKARVRLDTDTESRRLVEDYDQWYAEWSIQDLLAERLSMKGAKAVKSRQRGPAKSGNGRSKGTTSANSVGGPAVAGSQAANGPPLGVVPMQMPFGQGGRTVAALPNGMLPMAAGHQPPAGGASQRIDPLLQPQPGFYGLPQEQAQTGFHGTSQMQTQTGFGGQSHHQPLQMHQTYGSPAFMFPVQQPHLPAPPAQPRYHRLSTVDFATHVITSQPEISDSVLPNLIDEDNRRKAARQAVERTRQMLRETTGETASLTQVDETTPEGTLNTDDWSLISTPSGLQFGSTNDLNELPNCKVKGVVFPGMGCFDAATPEQRQKRNQKKTDEQYGALERISEMLLKTLGWENIWQRQEDDIFAPLKARLITGHPTASELGSPSSSRESSPAPTSRATRARAATRSQARRTVDGRLNNEITFGAVYGLAGRLHIPEDDDDDDASINTFAAPASSRRFDESQLRPDGRPRASTFRRRRLADENEINESLTGTRTNKTDGDGTGSTRSLVMPSTERPPVLPHYESPPTLGNPLLQSLGPNSMFPPPSAAPWNMPTQQSPVRRPVQTPVRQSPSQNPFSQQMTFGYSAEQMGRQLPPLHSQFNSPTGYYGQPPMSNFAHQNTMSSPFTRQTQFPSNNPTTYGAIFAGHAASPQASWQNTGFGTNAYMSNGFNFGISTGAGMNMGFTSNINTPLNHLAQAAAHSPADDLFAVDADAILDTGDEDRTLTAPSESDPLPVIGQDGAPAAESADTIDDDA